MQVKRPITVSLTTLAIVGGALFGASVSTAATSPAPTPVSYSTTSTQPIPVTQPSQAIIQKFYQMGGTYTFGAQTAPEYKLKDGSYKSYANGTIYWSPSTGAWAVMRQLDTEYKAEGIANGALGFPLSDESINASGVVVQNFQGGVITMDTRPQPYTPLIARAVSGEYAKKFTAAGGANVLGAATTKPAGIYSGSVQRFKNGVVTTSATGGTFLISDKRILEFWNNSYYGSIVQLPTTDVYRTVDGGIAQKFQNGYVHITSSGWLLTGYGPGTAANAPAPAPVTAP